MGIITLLMGNKNLVIGVILLALLAGTGIYIKVLKTEVESAKAKVTVLTNDLQISEASVKSLQQAISDQNAAIIKLGTDATARVAAHQVELAKAKTSADIYQKQAQELMNRKPPQNEPKCDAANDLINEGIKNAK